MQPLSKECQAVDVNVVKPDNLTEPVKKELEKFLGRNLTDGIATYYVGFPDPFGSDLQFTALCAFGSGLPTVPYCLNVTLVNGNFSATPIVKEEFLDFYRNCSNDPKFELQRNILVASQ